MGVLSVPVEFLNEFSTYQWICQITNLLGNYEYDQTDQMNSNVANFALSSGL
jgi:hypothetical protein